MGGGVVLSGTQPGGLILRSTNYGLNWTSLGRQFTQDSIYSIEHLGDGIVLAGTDSPGHILRSTDYGLNWSDLGRQYSQTHIISLADFGGGIVCAGTGAGGLILRSTNYGLNWTSLGQQFSQSYIGSMVSAGAGIGLAGTQNSGKILRTTNYGANWTDLGQQFSQTGIYSLCYLGDGIALAGTNAGRILRSTDYGASWSDLGQQHAVSEIYGIYYLGDGIVLAGTSLSGKILRSTDYGLNWSDLGQQYGETYVYKYIFLGNGISLAGTGSHGHILRSVGSGSDDEISVASDVATIAESESTVCTVTLSSAAPAGGVTITIAISDEDSLVATNLSDEPIAEVVVAEGETVASFILVGVTDGVADGDATVIVTLTADGWDGDSLTITVTDDDAAEPEPEPPIPTLSTVQSSWRVPNPYNHKEVRNAFQKLGISIDRHNNDIAVLSAILAGLDEDDETVIEGRVSDLEDVSASNYEAEAAENIAAGMPIYGVDGLANAGVARADTASKGRVAGLAVTAAASGFTVTYQSDGRFELADWTTVAGVATLTPSSVYYLAETGGLTTIAPTAASQTLTEVGRAVETTVLDLCIKRPILL
jgi:hypothetical protein